MFKHALRSFGLYLVSLGANAPARKPANVVAKKKFDKRAQKLVRQRSRQNEKLTVGSIQLVGLDDAKRALGKAWPKVAKKANSIAERIIESHLTTDDICTRQGNENFVICFATLDERQAATTARRISDEIKESLLREAPTVADHVRVRDYVADIESDYVITDDRSLVESLLGSLERMRVDAERSIQERRAALIRNARVLFRPVWHARKKAVQFYRCVLDPHTGGAALEHFRAISEPEALREALAELDYLVFSRVIEALHALIQKEAKALFLVPVHFQTVANKASREAYLKLLATVPVAYKKFLFCEIYSVPGGTPATRLGEIVTALQAHARGVIVEVGGPSQAGALSDARAWGMSIDAGEASGANGDLHAPRLKRCVELANAHNVTTFVHGMRTIGQLKAAIETGFDLIDGDAVHRCLEEPRGVFSFTPQSNAGHHTAESTTSARAASFAAQ